MKRIKKNFVYLSSCTIILLHSVSLYAMEREKKQDHIEQDWQYGKREKMNLYCIPDRNDQLYPYFPEKNDSDVKPSLLSDQVIMREYERTFGENYDVLSLSSENKKTLGFVLQTIEETDTSLRIEGRDKEFAQTMSRCVLDLPLHVRQTIARQYGDKMMCNTQYEQSKWDALLHDEYNKKACVCGTAFCVSELFLWFFLWRLTWGMPVGGMAKYIVSQAVARMGCCAWVYAHGTKWLEEMPEKRDQRRGFESISLLKDMECTIVDGTTKAKID